MPELHGADGADEPTEREGYDDARDDVTQNDPLPTSGGPEGSDMASGGGQDHTPSVQGWQLAVPATASTEEASAITAAVVTHLTADDESDESSEPEYNRWKVASRIQGDQASRLPRTRPRGGAWIAAARSR